MPSTAFILYLLLSFLCSLINVVPTVSHMLQGHSGPACFGIWVVVLNALAFINGILWPHDAIDRAPIFCDISAKAVGLIGPLGLLISNWCIIRYLAHIVTPNKALECRETARRRMVADYSMSFGIPALIGLASLIVQVSRYQVYKLVGCSNVSALTWPGIFIVLMWSPILCGVSCGYSVYVLYWLIRQHTNLKALVAKSQTPLNLSRFVRMCALAATYLCISAPVTILGTITTVYDTGPYVPWTSWQTIHNDDNKLSDVRQNPLYELKSRDWVFVTSGSTVFIFFSFASESIIIYKRLVSLIRLDRLGKWVRPDRFLRGTLNKADGVKKVQFPAPLDHDHSINHPACPLRPFPAECPFIELNSHMCVSGVRDDNHVSVKQEHTLLCS
ncbi:mating type STE3 pheromone receptor [Melampsora larici-populina 98AG31]|uniref:Mating type STE3 pheromone receptor n=2 Tax=Melampsora laricis-populina TaxID=203908 RepID=F4SC88_MELLP|nr:mating type STE3 pheromone receptor [Melampsora larici-populina 98AG31]EGF97739.1 mating type STE3 pheromone receptor [Melampsora larici-populina 98AG31]